LMKADYRTRGGRISCEILARRAQQAPSPTCNRNAFHRRRTLSRYDKDWSGRMSAIDDRHSSSDRQHVPEAAPHGFWHGTKQFLLGTIGVALITLAAVRFHVETLPARGVGPGTVSLFYLIVVVFVSLRGGFISAGAVSLIAVFCLNYFYLPLVQSLAVKNPLDIVATVAFLVTAWVITGIVSQLRERNALLDGLFEQAPEAIALVNLDSSVFRVNKEFTRVFGYTWALHPVGLNHHRRRVLKARQVPHLPLADLMDLAGRNMLHASGANQPQPSLLPPYP
jgi:PAS domain-containing protein